MKVSARALAIVIITIGAAMIAWSSDESSARADEPAATEEMDPTTLFKSANEAIIAERPTEAIAKLESLADRGVVDAVVSYDRGLAYAARVRGGPTSEQPGDLGRAAHGFEEARDLTRDPALNAEATNALTIVRSEIARRRSRSGDPVEIEHGFSLGRSIVGLLPENVWAILALLSSIVLTIGIIARRQLQQPRAKVAATTAGAIAGALLVLTSIISWAARDARLHLREGIVITPNARLLDEKHLAKDGVSPIPEGVRAHIIEESGGFSRIAIGGTEGYLPSSAVLPLAKR